ncbi:SDR family oxidoreductase [Nocardioides sp. LS1]|uniref:SDR family NAD(P)-dependent oxidoreductase n=1 Tax=Nocardioides sp. LS1 TaxID=1027620 RepID=UPI000F619C43|nr:SDR family NAD(P)-dependent oxidoreductase [Nocardioides sp. LS1]GCD88125.1 short-chain dehydrogenase [Nocardioides sp. LS1]
MKLISKPRPLAGQTVLITGASSGMGRALAQRLSSHGCPVAILDHNTEGLEKTAASLSGPVLTRTIDVRDRAALDDFAGAVGEWAPAPLGAVFNNAGVFLAAPFGEQSAADHDWLMDINLLGVVNGTRAFLPLLTAQGSGALVNTSSMYGLAAMEYHTAYCASKYAVRGFTDALRHELAGTGVRAVNVHPGYVSTAIVDNGRLQDPFGRSLAEVADEFRAAAPTTPERAAELIHRGVDAGKARVLVGPDARIFDVVTRLTPSHYNTVLGRLERLMELRGRRRG